jgi:hypothetical protein
MQMKKNSHKRTMRIMGPAVILLFLSFSCLSYGQVNTTDADFLKIDTGARNAGMAGATTALADDIEALPVNIAGLAQMDRAQLFLEHAEWFQSMRYESLSIGTPLKALRGAIGLNIKYYYMTPFEHYNDWGFTVKKVGFSSLQMKAGYSMALLKNSRFQLQAGAAFGFLQQQLDDASYSSLSSDLGLKAVFISPFPDAKNIFGESLDIGFAVQNIGLVNNRQLNLPLLIKAGLGLKLFNLISMGVDLEKYNDRTVGLNMGWEYGYKDFIFLRVGVKLGQDQFYNFIPGVGFKHKLWDRVFYFDYTTTPTTGDLGMTHRFSVKMDLDSGTPSMKKSSDRLYYQGIYYFNQNQYDKAIASWSEISKEEGVYSKAVERIKETELIKEQEKNLKAVLPRVEKKYTGVQKDTKAAGGK